ncbi:MAG: glucose 1-dehydrogenase [Actinomycetota bacterium]|nr:glucose 1-dehydrogenase [Actinomycetota bacterium]
MKAVGLVRGKEGVHLFDAPKPTITSPRQVLVKVIEAGIDGTDFETVTHNRFSMSQEEDTMIIGHEAVGIIEEVGSEVSTLAVGDVVVPTVRRGCGLCAPCLHNRSDMCQTGLYTERGIKGANGYFTEFFVDDEDYLVRVPDGLEPYAVLSEPLSIAEKAVDEIKHFRSRVFWSCNHPEHSIESQGWGNCKVALVIGAGSLGFLSTAVLRLSGIHTFVAEIAPEDSLKVRLIKELGAHYLNTKDKTAHEVTAEIGNPDIIIEASGATELALNLTTGLARNGVCVLTGIPSGSKEVCLEGDLMARTLVLENQIVFGSVNSGRTHFDMALQDLQRLREEYGTTLSKVIQTRYSLGDYKDAFLKRDAEGIKSVFNIYEGGV